MKAVYLTLLLMVFASCESEEEQIKSTEIQRINRKLIGLENKLRKFDVNQPLNERYYDSLAHLYFDEVKNDKALVGFYLGTPFDTYCSKNFMNWAVEAEADEIYTDSTLFKFMRRADIHHSEKNLHQQKVSSSNPYSIYSKTTKDVMYVSYNMESAMLNLQLFYKLSKPYPAKFNNGKYETLSSMVMNGDYVVLE